MKIRTTQPKNNKYYIRQATGGLNGAVAGNPTVAGANVLCNCVGFANGRFNEIINDPDLKGIVKPFKYQLVCNAENFIESAKRQGLKISSKPTVGGIMVWQKGSTLGGGDGAGHVEVVEEIYKDGSINCSSSGWNGWAFRLMRRNNSNGRWGQASGYKFRGCIINPSIGGGEPVPTPKLVVDGVGGTATIMRLQEFLGCKSQDGIIGGQSKSLDKYRASLKAVSYGSGGSSCVKKMQAWLGITQDGGWGKDTSKALQTRLKKEGYDIGKDGIDGYFGADSMRALQKYLNEHDKPTPTPSPTPTKKKYKAIDVSEWQGVIDWKKVKADGVVGAIIRYADGDYVDKYFDRNMQNAKANGIHIGAYIFSRAKTVAQAEKEAERLYNACKKYSPDLPLYIDLEDNSLKKYANTVGNAFCKKMKALGGFAGVYANVNWWNNYLTKCNPQSRWVAQYYTECQYKGAYGMWQYSSSGSVKGISGRVDMDWLYVDYWNIIKPTPTKKGYQGKFPEYRIKKTNKQVIDDTIAWLKYIASNNNFHYGHGRAAHKNGCYFCGTEPSSKGKAGIKDWKTTYCCNPFVHAGWAHGGCIPRAMKICRDYGSWSFDTGSGTYHSCNLFTKLGKPKQSSLKPGDVLCSDTHVALYIGGGNVVQAGHEDDNIKNSSSWNSSISIGKWNGWDRAYRFNSKVDANMSIFYGELSDRVKDLCGFLDWYFDGKVGISDRFYGDKLVSWVKKFQKEQGLTVSGLVDAKTIEAMKKVRK